MPAKRRPAPSDQTPTVVAAPGETVDRVKKTKQKPARIVSLCVRGSDDAPSTRKRRKLLKRLIEAVIERTCWSDLDAVLLPGGFFRMKRFVGGFDEQRRLDLVAASAPGRACAALSSKLSERWPGVALCVGIDSEAPTKRIGGDQMLVVWRDGRLVTLARKAFPTDGDTNRKKRIFAVHPEDYRSAGRFISLKSGVQAALCACYDAFGLRAASDPVLADVKAIRSLLIGPAETVPATPEDRERALMTWSASVAAHRPSLALVAIHRFKKPGQEGYWQRHGLAGASAALHGGPAIGAAHFVKRLPKSTSESPLAASDAPTSHLDRGSRRTAHLRKPDGALAITDKRGRAIAIARLFAFPGSP